jgi:hypothetical protein
MMSYKKLVLFLAAICLMAPVTANAASDKGSDKDKSTNSGPGNNSSDNKNEGKGHDKDKEEKERAKWLKDAYAQALAEDKANGVQKFDVEVVFPVVSKASGGDAVNILSNGKPEISMSVGVYGLGVTPVLKLAGSNQELAQLKKYFTFSMSSKELNAVGTEAVQKCEAMAREAALSKSKLKVKIDGLPRHNVIVTQRELIDAYGLAFIRSRMGASAQKISFGDFKKYVKDIGEVVQARNHISFWNAGQKVSCEIVK